MHIAILGAGPAGLYLSYLIKRRQPGAEVTVIEQNPADATFGFGVVFSDRALEFLRGDDPETYAAIVPHMESWNDMTLVHRGERVVIDGIGFAAIGRLMLLQLLQARAARSVLRRFTAAPSKALMNSLTPISLSAPTASIRWCAAASETEFGASVRHPDQSLCLVRHHKTLRNADADICSRPSSAVLTPIIIATAAGLQHIYRRGR